MKESTKRKAAHSVFTASWVLIAIAMVIILITWSSAGVYALWLSCLVAFVTGELERYYIHLVKTNLQEIVVAIGEDSRDADRGTHYVDVTSEEIDFSVEYRYEFETREKVYVEYLGDKEKTTVRYDEKVTIVNIEAYDEDGQIDSEAVDILKGRTIDVVRAQ